MAVAKRFSSKPLSTNCATEPNRVWSWDITYLPDPAKGLHFYLYLILAIIAIVALNFLRHISATSVRGEEILAKRHQPSYMIAKKEHPERWTGSTRDWPIDNEVWLNPDQSQVDGTDKPQEFIS